MDKRKTEIISEEDTTHTKFKYGSGYKKTAKTSMFNIDIKLDDPNSIQKMKESVLTPISANEELIFKLENIILSWLKENDMPTSVGKNKYLPLTLRKNFMHIKGAFEASFCLTSIAHCKIQAKSKDFERAYVEALELVGHMQTFQYSILEPTLAKGNAKKNIENKRTLNEQQIALTMAYYKSDECIFNRDKRKLGLMARREKAAEWARKEFNLKGLTAQTLQKSYNFK
jgi:hypothetical protein